MSICSVIHCSVPPQGGRGPPHTLGFKATSERSHSPVWSKGGDWPEPPSQAPLSLLSTAYVSSASVCLPTLSQHLPMFLPVYRGTIITERQQNATTSTTLVLYLKWCPPTLHASLSHSSNRASSPLQSFLQATFNSLLYLYN